MKNKIQQWETTLGQWLIPNIEEVIPYLPENYTFIDIGANTGLFTKMILDKRPDYHLIHMFEPIEEYELECVSKFSDYENIYVHHIGMSDITETKMIKMDSTNLGYNKIGDDGNLQINLINFTDFANKTFLNNVDFIKIDTEGYDTKVLKGMEEWIRLTDKKPVIYFERGWDIEDELDTVHNYINNIGYKKFIECKHDYLLIP